MTRGLRAVDRPVLIAFGFIVVLIILGSIYNRHAPSALYLLQQLQVASFLGIVASGLMLTILLGQIDLSIPWVVTIGGITATAAAGWWGESWTALGVPFAIACGGLVGLANGLGVAFLRIPSMVFTLDEMAIIGDLAVSGRINLEGLVDGTITLDELGSTIDDLANRRTDAVKILVDPRAG